MANVQEQLAQVNHINGELHHNENARIGLVSHVLTVLW